MPRHADGPEEGHSSLPVERDDLPTPDESASADAGSPDDLAVQRWEAAHFSGPLPPPRILAGYNDAIPGGAERILRMAEREQEHRHATQTALIQAETEQDKRLTDATIEVERRGLDRATWIVFGFLGGSILLGLTGHEIASAALGGTTVVGLAAIFITRTVRRHRE
jgi:uncharacterized membrane protein